LTEQEKFFSIGSCGVLSVLSAVALLRSSVNFIKLFTAVSYDFSK
jgi:hypothetical protein